MSSPTVLEQSSIFLCGVVLFVLFVVVLCLVCPMLLVFLDFPLVAPPSLSNVYLSLNKMHQVLNVIYVCICVHAEIKHDRYKQRAMNPKEYHLIYNIMSCHYRVDYIRTYLSCNFLCMSMLT